MRRLFGLLMFAAILASCTSLQKDVNIEQVSFSEEVVAFEQRLASIDAASMLPDSDLNARLQKEQACEDFLDDISDALSDPAVQKAARARLFALEGKAFLILGKRGDAEKSLKKSAAEYKGDAEALVLSYRLGELKVANIEEKSGEVFEKPLLTLERAIELYKNMRYTNSVAKFDEAFLSLDEFYADSYRKIRDLAWDMRGVSSDSDVAHLMPLSEISVSQMLLIAREKSEYLYGLSGGKKLSEKNLFNRASSAGLLNPVSKPLDAQNALGSSDTVTRYHSARFLWNLYGATKNQFDSRKYSDKLKKSPVRDLDLDSPDFDAVLGCVEEELMSLEDGRSFGGEKPVSAVEFDRYMEKLK